MSRAIFLIFISFGGAAILVWLGTWQLQRLTWKQDVLATIEARIAGAPNALAGLVEPEKDNYLPVRVEGQFDTSFLRILVSQKDIGAGYRVISPFEVGDRRIMVDRGFIAVDQANVVPPQNVVRVVGNLQWPNEIDSFTPMPDLDQNIWFARDVDAMSAALQTEPILLVAREPIPGDTSLTALPVDTSQIPNNHLQYAVTWFSLAAVWLAMSFLFLRHRRGKFATKN
ncbi:MAG: SURF1 family protein [Pseudomonadota bacterium]